MGIILDNVSYTYQERPFASTALSDVSLTIGWILFSNWAYRKWEINNSTTFEWFARSYRGSVRV